MATEGLRDVGPWCICTDGCGWISMNHQTAWTWNKLNHGSSVNYTYDMITYVIISIISVYIGWLEWSRMFAVSFVDTPCQYLIISIYLNPVPMLLSSCATGPGLHMVSSAHLPLACQVPFPCLVSCFHWPHALVGQMRPWNTRTWQIGWVAMADLCRSCTFCHILSLSHPFTSFFWFLQLPGLCWEKYARRCKGVYLTT